jgi:hypothetical protein
MRPSLDEYVRLNLIIRTPESPTGEMPKVEAPAKAKPGTKRVKVS